LPAIAVRGHPPVVLAGGVIRRRKAT